MINLDPSIINQESLRKKRRKKLLLIFIAPVTVLTLAGLFFLRPGMFDILFGMNYDNKDSGMIVSLGQMQKVANIIEPYIAYYNAGTAYLKDGDGIKAEAELRESIKKLPPQDKICQVRTNLSYSIEIQADEAMINRKYDEALVLYSRAEGILYEDNCASKQDAQEIKDKMIDAAIKRITRKRGTVVSEMNNSGDGSDVDPETGGLEIDEDQLEQMRSNARNGNDVRSMVLERGSRGGSYGGYGSYNYHW